MSDAILEQMLQLSEQLTADESLKLMQHIQSKLPRKLPGTVTRDRLLAEHVRLKAAGAFDRGASLRGKYANADINLSVDELQAHLRDIRNAWEQDVNEIINDD